MKTFYETAAERIWEQVVSLLGPLDRSILRRAQTVVDYFATVIRQEHARQQPKEYALYVFAEKIAQLHTDADLEEGLSGDDASETLTSLVNEAKKITGVRQ